MKKYKVVQWATGGMGKNCLRAVIDHPAMELVGVYVYGAALRLARCGHPAPAGGGQERHQHQRLQPAAALGWRASCGAGISVQKWRDVAARRGLESGLCR